MPVPPIPLSKPLLPRGFVAKRTRDDNIMFVVDYDIDACSLAGGGRWATGALFADQERGGRVARENLSG